jgi:hypothetical protein
MKITEITIVPTKDVDTTSSATTSSISQADQTQDIVPQDIVSENFVGTIEEHPDHSAIAEGVSQILRRKKGGAPTKGFRCTSGPRKGRIVASPSTCFAKLNPSKGAKIRAKRLRKAKTTGVKLGQTKRSGAGSLRLKGTQIKRQKGTQPRHGKGPRSGSRPLQKSKVIKPKK